MKRKRLLLVGILALSLLEVPAVSMASAEKVAIDGSFVTGDLCGFWTDARWQQQFTAMKNAGMHYIIIQAVADSYPGKVTQTLYPSSLPNTEMAKGGNGVTYPDIVDACLRNAESAGMKVFIGIDMSNKWWSSYGNDSSWLYSQMDFDNKVCDEVWSLYKSKYPDAFYGWYWSYEVDNVNFTTKPQQEVLTTAMNMQLDHLTSANERLPFMWCPFMNSQLGTPQAYETVWKNLLSGLHTTTGDVFCPQDCVGAGGLKLSEVASWFSALRQAVDTKTGLAMWSDVETFEIYSNAYISAPIGRVVSQLQTEQPYVDNYITWEYLYYDSPYNVNPGFQATYIDYLKTGSVETNPPTTPAKFAAVLQADGDVVLNWDAPTDDIGVCGYNVYRNREMIGKNQVPITNGDIAISAAPTSFTDAGLSPNTNYTYWIEAYDFAGNLSDSTPSITVTTGNFTVASLGRPYTVSVSPSGNYPDPNGKKLTDGQFATQAYYADPAWVGFTSPDTLNVLIDLGQTTPVQQFMGEYLLDPQPAVYLPQQVYVSVSTDNVTFTKLDTLRDGGTNHATSSIHKYYYTLSSAVNARYVKFSTVAQSGAWIFVDEYEVFNSVASGIRQQTSSVPAKFDLSNNYPNPFNPSTNIQVSLNHSGEMSLKIYNVLGQLMKVIDEGNRAAGNYIYNVEMDHFPSGVYFYTLQQGLNMMTKKVILLK